MIPLTALLLLGAFVVTMLSAVGKAPLWPAVLLVIVAALLPLYGR